MQPLLDATEKINFFVKKYPNSDYSSDLRFKIDLIQNQLAAKELYVAKYYMKTQKWIPAINRLKVIVKKYEKTIFIEEALHRLVEIHYYLGLEKEAKKYELIRPVASHFTNHSCHDEVSLQENIRHFPHLFFKSKLMGQKSQISIPQLHGGTQVLSWFVTI